MTAGRLLAAGTRCSRRFRGAALLGLLLVAAPASGQDAPDEPMPLTEPTRQALAEIKEQWSAWLGGYVGGQEDEQEVALAALEAALAGLGGARLPDLGVAAAAKAVQYAEEGDFARARIGIKAAERLAPGQPEVAFAGAVVERAAGSTLEAIRSHFRGYRLLMEAPLDRFVWLTNVLLWALAVLLLVGAAFVVCQMAAKGDLLLADLLGVLRPHMPGAAVIGATFLVLVWPVFLPSGLWWLVIYWSILFWAYASRVERGLMVVFWLLLAVAPSIADLQRRRVEVALAPALRATEVAVRGDLEGDLFNDLGLLEGLAPDSPAVRHLLADVNRRLGQLAAAKDLYLDVLDQEPRNEAALVDLGVCYFELGEIERAIEFFGLAQALDAPSAAGFFNSSQAYSRLYDFNQSGEALRLAQRIDNERVTKWLAAAEVEPVTTMNGSAHRLAEVRTELERVWRGEQSEPAWVGVWRASRSAPLAILFVGVAVALHWLRRRYGIAAGSYQGRPWRGAWWVPALLPGWAEAREDRWGAAWAALLAVCVLLTLPSAGGFGYPVPWGFQPGGFLVGLTALLGLAAVLGLRLWRRRSGA